MNIDDIEEVYQPFSRQTTGKATPRVFALYILFFAFGLCTDAVSAGSSRYTRLLFCTTGVLLNRLNASPDLEGRLVINYRNCGTGCWCRANSFDAQGHPHRVG